MPIVEAITFKDWRGKERKVRFVGELAEGTLKRYETTIITGRNGSNKSPLLRELVGSLTIASRSDSVQLRAGSEAAPHVICVSGSVADRFPPKETPGGRNSEYAVPAYSYLGQRVGPNLLSKKRPLETLLTFALDEKKATRFQWDFFEQAHRFAGVMPQVDYYIVPKRRQQKIPTQDLLGIVQGIASRANAETTASPKNGAREALLAHVSPAMAAWLLEEFSYDEFNDLPSLLMSKKGRLSLKVGLNGASCDAASNAVLRLGLLTDLLSLGDASVRTSSMSPAFSAFDLSSGEYHMFASILGLGLGVDQSSVVLIDEPENSLHPQWQRQFMDTILSICSQALNDGHLMVCTHSPLIVGAAPSGSAIVDLAEDAPAVESAAFGASSDELLLTQFGVGSSRNRLVVDVVQRAVSLVERGDFQNQDFLAMKGELTKIRELLRNDDPLADVIDALLEERSE